MFAGEGDAVPHQPPLPPAGRGPARHPAVDRVRLGDALRLRPRRAARHLRQGRQLRRVDRHARRHEGALRRLRPVRPDDLGVDDDQRPGPDDPGHVPQHRDRPAHRRVRRARGPAAERRRGRRDPGRGAANGPGHGAGRHPQGGPGPEHLHLLDRVRPADDGRHPGVVRRRSEVRNFYSVSISGYHIAEAGANPISQLAFTLANGFTYVEAYLARGMAVDDFAPNLSFFFSNGMDPEYTVLGRVARRDLGRGACATATAPTSGPRSSSTTSRPRAGRCTPRRWRSTTSAPRCRRSSRSTTTATACTPTPTTRRSPRRRPSRCGGRWRSS